MGRILPSERRKMKKFFYPERNRLFLTLSILMCISLLVIARYSTWPALPGFEFLAGPVPEDSIPYDIAMGFLASYIFYLIQVYIPQRSREIKSLESLELYIKAYLRNARLFYALLQDYEFTELPKYANNMPAYYYDHKESVTERFIPLSKNVPDSDGIEDGIYNFLLKTTTIYEQMVSNPAFSMMDAFLVEQIQAINIPYWFEVYEKVLVLIKNGYGKEIRPFQRDEKQMELIKELGIAIDKTEKYLGICCTVRKQ